MQGLIYPNFTLLPIWNSQLAGHPTFLFAPSGNSRWELDGKMGGSGKWGIYKAHSTTGDWSGARIRKDVSKRQPGQEVGLRAEVRRLAFFCSIPANDNLESTRYKWRKFHSQIYLRGSHTVQWDERKYRRQNILSVFSSLQFSRLVVSDSLRPHELQHAGSPCPSPTPRAYTNSCPLSRWCHPAISSSVVPFSSCPQSFPASASFPVSQFFASGGQSIGVSASASVLPMNIQDWSPLGWTGWISLQSKGLSSLLQHHSSKAPVLWC